MKTKRKENLDEKTHFTRYFLPFGLEETVKGKQRFKWDPQENFFSLVTKKHKDDGYFIVLTKIPIFLQFRIIYKNDNK